MRQDLVFGDLVRARRRRVGLSQEELAGKTGISVRGLRKIEANQVDSPRPVTVRMLAQALGLSGADRDRFYDVARRTDPPSGHLVPAQLPADVPGFIGRTDQLRQLSMLVEHSNGAHPTALVVIAIAGTAGVGKTALAVHWAHQIRSRFPDGQLYVNLRGFDPNGTTMDPAEVCRRFLDALDVPLARIPADLDAQAGLYRTLLADRRMLVVLDNARDAEQVRPLLPGAPGNLVIITSRHRLDSLVATDGGYPVALDLLTPDEARDLLASRLGASRLAEDPQAVEEIIEYCAGLPLALAIAAARAATSADLPLRTLAAELRVSPDRLDVLSAHDPTTDLRAVFSSSYRTLTPEAAGLFRLVGLHPGPDVSTAAAASLAGLPPPRVRPLLAELARAHLIIECTAGRYTVHDLLRTYAAEQNRSTDPDPQRRAAAHRMLDHYLHTAYAADRLLHPARDRIVLGPPHPDAHPETVTNHQQAYDWLAAERPVLLAAVEYAERAGFDTHVWQLAWAVHSFLDRCGLWHDQTVTLRAALSAAGRLADPVAQALAHRLIAHTEIALAHFEEAEAHLRDADDLYRAARDQVGQAHVHVLLDMASARQGREADALGHARRALSLYRAADHQTGQALALNNIGWLHARLGNYGQALNWCRQALALHQRLANRVGQGATWDSLGYAEHHLGRHDEAIACYKQALDLFQDLGDRYREADTLVNLAETHEAAGDPRAAREARTQALGILEDLDHPQANAVRVKLAIVD
ncbi:MAG: hypothetical protein V7603_2221 [Micromonosporaceae bacterium]